jgi:hypothetical protein
MLYLYLNNTEQILSVDIGYQVIDTLSKEIVKVIVKDKLQ